MYNFNEMLSGGDLRSIGNSNKVVNIVKNNPDLFDNLFSCLYSSSKIIRMRAADAIEKISLDSPTLLNKYKSALLLDISKIDQPEVQWHFAQIISRLELDSADLDHVTSILKSNLKSTKSNIVKTFCLQSLYDLSLQHKEISKSVKSLLEFYSNDKSAAVRSRVKKLLN